MTAAPKINLAAWQEHFDFLLPRKELLRADEVAKALGCDERTILRHFEERNLLGHDINAGTGQRQQIRYRRDSVVMLLARRANYEPTDLRDQLFELLTKQPTADLVLIQQAIGQLIQRRAR